MNIAVIGAGGVGGYYGGVLARAGHRVIMLARREHLSAIRAKGLEIRTGEERFVAPVLAAERTDELKGAELVIVTVKSYSLHEVLPEIRRLAEAGSLVLPLLNGVDTVERLVSGDVPKEGILGGLTSISVIRTAPGVIERRSSFAHVAVGEPSGGLSERAERIASTFVEAGVDARAVADITLELWRKFAFITTLAAACGMSRSPVGAVRGTKLGGLLLERSVREIYAVGKARGVAVADNDAQKTLETIQGLAPELKPSFLLDLEQGGPTELDVLSGAISRMGRETGIETPIHDTATATLSAALSA